MTPIIYKLNLYLEQGEPMFLGGTFNLAVVLPRSFVVALNYISDIPLYSVIIKPMKQGYLY